VPILSPVQSLDFSNFAAVYDDCFVGPLFQPGANMLVSRLAPSGGERALDVACGTGIVARTVRARLGSAVSIVGVDVNPVMLAMARHFAPDIEWREGNATTLPLGDGEQFDLVFCQQGLPFFAERPAAARQFRRALTAGGRLGVATWRPDDEIPVFRQIRAVAEQYLGPIADQRHSFADAEPLVRLLQQAGFMDVQVETRAVTTRLPDGPLFARLNTMALLGMSRRADALSEPERSRLAAKIFEQCVQRVLPYYADGPGVVIVTRMNVATARA
jgi:ubiquinone/menaquinone biosynthesis C-methylase UbiE